MCPHGSHHHMAMALKHRIALFSARLNIDIFQPTAQHAIEFADRLEIDRGRECRQPLIRTITPGFQVVMFVIYGIGINALILAHGGLKAQRQD